MSTVLHTMLLEDFYIFANMEEKYFHWNSDILTIMQNEAFSLKEMRHDILLQIRPSQ